MSITKNKIIFLQILLNICLLVLLISPNALALVPAPYINIRVPQTPIPGAKAVNLSELAGLISIIASFLIIVGPVILVIGLIVSALMYMKAGGDPAAATKALTFLKNNVLGGLIVFGFGVIIDTVAAIVTRQFFCPHLGISIGGFGSICF